MNKTHRYINRQLIIGLSLLGTLALTSCATGMKPAMDREADTFLSEVRYLISRQEKKQFKNLPPTERRAFIEEFWKIRDPSPETDVNEYKEEYYQRIEKANRLFHEGGAGWLSDRGRIFILIGEPDRRDTYPSGYSFYEPPVEIWYYGFFTIVFVDNDREGIYRLSAESGQKLNAINSAQMYFKHEGLTTNPMDFNFKLSFSKRDNQSALLIRIPYSLISFNENKAEQSYATRLHYTLTVSNNQGKTVFKNQDSIPLSLKAKEFLADEGEFSATLPLELAPGRYRAVLYIENEADKKKKGQSLSFKIK